MRTREKEDARGTVSMTEVRNTVLLTSAPPTLARISFRLCGRGASAVQPGLPANATVQHATDTHSRATGQRVSQVRQACGLAARRRCATTELGGQRPLNTSLPTQNDPRRHARDQQGAIKLAMPCIDRCQTGHRHQSAPAGGTAAPDHASSVTRARAVATALRI